MSMTRDPRQSGRRALIRRIGMMAGAGALSLMVPPPLRAAVWAKEHDAVEKPNLVLGFIPLTDCAPLVVAAEKGYFVRHGLNVRLSREPSWANIRDKVAIGALDGAHMLAPLPIAMTLGIGGLRVPMVTALSLDVNGNAITVSNALYARMAAVDGETLARRPVSAHALRQVIEEDRAAGKPPMTFAVVFPISSHNYLLRYWMASAGIDPDRDVRIIVVPPPQIVESLRAGNIVGYCVGEPWNEQAVMTGLGHILITSYEVWNNGPEKVLGVTRQWAERHPLTHLALLQALLEAAQWLDVPENRGEAAELISRPQYVDAPEQVVRMSMTGSLLYRLGDAPVQVPDFHVFHRNAANFPWRSHAEWFLAQMVRWGQIGPNADIRRVASDVYRPETYRVAAQALGLPSPTVDRKWEGIHRGPWTLQEATAPIAMGPDWYFDGMTFDPTSLSAYAAGFPIRRNTVSSDRTAVPIA